MTQGHEVRCPKGRERGGVLGRAHSPSPPATGGLRERCKLPPTSSGAAPRTPSGFTTFEVLSGVVTEDRKSQECS